jgi:hypothetical protein
MNIWDFFRSAEVLRALFLLGYIPKREEFYELTPEQYERYYETEGQGESKNQKIFMLLPHDVERYNEIASGDVFVMTEEEISYFNDAERIVDSYCKNSDKTFNSLEEKLYYVAKFVPDVFIEGTKFERKQAQLIYLKKDKKKKGKKP